MKRALYVIAAAVTLAGALPLLVGPRFYVMICTGSNSTIALAKCKEYYDAAVLWTQVRGEPPVRLEDMEAPLRPGESAFIESVEDPWGNPYVLERDGNDIRVSSWGPDGQDGTEDDLVCPEEER